MQKIPAQVCIRNLPHLHKICTMNLEPVLRDVEIIYIHGVSGVGKTHMSKDLTDKLYWKLSTNKWWDGYQGQQHIFIGDLHDHITPTHLNRWLDNYHLLLDIKDGTLPAQFTKVVIPSNYDVDHIGGHTRL
ncbi:hypothetical protein HZS_5466 [Henneguya salminicola]|uniref:Replication-associated protein (Trinotate prediction) n=1 Tax=Henneguya salminicola TaxID=69463 RepID=A0A6G3MJM0_HENSL|nr:hypothetical protein HZS_5466 [Henneguya salminicola]